ncbi:MAG: hypothetical protein A3G41_08075, partial [Elusimicrobia bacterium RIFCSPLOWO2_12_FULL_59_9]
MAACRAALIATLLPDPGTPEKRRELCEKIAGTLVKKIERKKMPNGEVIERDKELTEGGILHWGRETSNKEQLEWFRKEIRKAYGGRSPKVLDPFAGGGAIPLEAMRLGCEVTAVDINPVAWFILKCTLEYPQKFAGQTHPLPDFILDNEEFMEAFYKAHPQLIGRTKWTKRQKEEFSQDFFMQEKEDSVRSPKADIAWHVRAWGQWVLDRARKDLAKFYPTYADFEPLPLTGKDRKDGILPKPFERRPMRLVPLKKDGTPDIRALNKDYSKGYLADKTNPRWVAKPTVAYLWARTVKCKNCRATVPLLKTRWLCKTDRKRVILKMEPNSSKDGVIFEIEPNVPPKGGNAAQRRENDKRLGAGTMSRSGGKCPCCGAIMTMDDIRTEGKAGKMSYMPTATIVDGIKGKEHRIPTAHEIKCAADVVAELPKVFLGVPFGLPTESAPLGGGRGAARAFSIQGYGLRRWQDLFSKRQLLALGVLVKCVRSAGLEMSKKGYPAKWREVLVSYLACGVDRFVDFANVNVQWKVDADTINHALVRFAIQITWDFAEGNPIGQNAGAFDLCINRIATGLDALAQLPAEMEAPDILHGSAQSRLPMVDLAITDPPYYDAIPYSDLMDWFYIWLRRMVFDLTPQHTTAMASSLGPKWDSQNNDGELIDDDTRHGGDAGLSKQAYEDGMARSFRRCFDSLNETGRLVIVFANKSPNAWETLVASVIKAGFIVEGSWPIQTEQPSRMRGLTSAALASSVWLVCKKRPDSARPGWDNQVLEDMRQNIRTMLREFWDAGIRGPDFVWAATGPALEAYSKHPVVKKANEPGPMLVGEFLTHVRRMVVDFVVGRVLAGEKDGNADLAATDRLDEPTAYYLLHRHDFGMDE